MQRAWRAVREHSFTIGLAAALGAVVTVAAATELTWSLFRDDPLLPVVGSTLRNAGDRIGSVLAVLTLVVLSVFLIRTQSAILIAVRQQRQGDEPPHDAEKIEMVIYAGTDPNVQITLSPTDGSSIVVASFSARQGDRAIVRNKPAPVEDGRVVDCVFTHKETKRLRDGILLVEIRYEDDRGRRRAAPAFWIPTKGYVVK